MTKCEICSKEFVNLGAHMKSHKTQTPPIPDKFDKLEKMVGDIVGVVSSLSEKVEKLTPKTEWQVQKKPGDDMLKKIDDKLDGSNLSVVPPKWRAIVDEILGKDFGLSVSYPDSGNGFQFSIVVPKDKSNAPKDYLEFYKADIRTKTIGNAEGSEGVKKYCELVKKNLTAKK
jgi:hypothetical protein